MKRSNDRERPPGGTPHEGGHDVTPHDRDQKSDRERTAPHRRYMPFPSRLQDSPNHQDWANKEEPQRLEEGGPPGDPKAKAQKEGPPRKKTRGLVHAYVGQDLTSLTPP
jgi:hypothetical protein